MNFNSKACGARIAAIRVSRGMTQEQLADALEISWSTVAKIEYGTRRLSLEVFFNLLELFHVSADYILCRDEPIEDTREKRTREIVAELSTIWNSASN